MSFNSNDNYNSHDDPDNLNDYDISQISGVDRDELERLLDSDEVFEPQTSNSPTAINKLLVVGGGVGIIVFLAFLLFGGFSQPKVAESTDTKDQETTTQITEQQNDEEMARLRAELALKDQKLSETSDLTKKKLDKEPEPEIKTDPKPQPQRQVQNRTQPKPRPRPQPQTTVQRQPKPNRQTQPQRQVQRRQSVQKKDEVDPEKRWDELADIGSYKAKEGTSNNQRNSNQQRNSDTIAFNNQRSTTNNPRRTLQRQRVAPVVNRSQSITQVDSNSIPRQNVAGVIKGGLAVPANSRSNNQLKVPIVISEAIKDNNGRTLIESGATIVSDISIDGSIVSFSPQTISFEKGGQYYELALDDSIIITGQQGPIIAQLQTLGEKNGLSIDQIGQLAGLSGVLGDDAKDLSVAISIFNSNNSSRRRSRNNIVQLFTLPQNTPVQVRVVRNIPFQMDDSDVTTSIKLRTESDFETTGLSFDEPEDNYVEEDEMITDNDGVITGDAGVITDDGYSNDDEIIVGDEYLDEGQSITDDEYLDEDEIITDEYLDEENLIAEEPIEYE